MIEAALSGGAHFGGGISVRSRLGGTVGRSDSYVPVYEGEYEVTPKVSEETTLPTKNKKLTADVQVKKIPQYEVSNEFGGETLIIGDEYYGS